MRVIGMAGGAALIGGLIILLGRKKKTPTEKLVAQAQSVSKDVRKAVKNANIASLLSDARDAANARLRDANLQDLTKTWSRVEPWPRSGPARRAWTWKRRSARSATAWARSRAAGGRGGGRLKSGARSRATSTSVRTR